MQFFKRITKENREVQSVATINSELRSKGESEREREEERPIPPRRRVIVLDFHAK